MSNLVSNVFIVDDNLVITLFEQPNQTGNAVVLTSKGLHNLQALDFNDIVSSLEIRAK